MEDSSQPPLADVVIAVVIELIETEGLDAVRLRDVARLAHLSLRTIYELFPGRDEMVVTAIERWMAANTYVDIAPAGPDETVYDGIMRTLRHVFEPWERSPGMLQAYYRARSLPGGERLDAQGFRAVGTVGLDVIAGAEPRYASDILILLHNMTHATLSRFAAGDLAVTDILPTLERAVHHLTADSSVDAALTLERRAAALAERAAEPGRRRRS